ncbi:hypothetical protein [Burkholderia cepacia]|uniref:hypothetical protein n=1 Tax=Burkholderia cepacia TaxID=292 RepID=UPI001CF2E34C|nr:hypothetical protein [Burkholderia cepacia]MCA8030984.1 hypothetical protein [Burkholderia cepacia]
MANAHPGQPWGALEFYDFIIYGIFAQFIGRAFFPMTDPLVALALSFAVFAIGYLSRPLGGIVLSYFGTSMVDAAYSSSQ